VKEFPGLTRVAPETIEAHGTEQRSVTRNSRWISNSMICGASSSIARERFGRTISTACKRSLGEHHEGNPRERTMAQPQAGTGAAQRLFRFPDRPGVVIAVMMGAFSGFLIGAASVILTQYAVLFTGF
jgi:hypothetical protein